MKMWLCAVCLAIAGFTLASPLAAEETRSGNGFVPGKGYGWIWGKDDEAGALNMMTDASRLDALQLAKSGKAYDLGVLITRGSRQFEGHSSFEIATFRSPEGVKRQDPFFAGPENKTGIAWHSCALFMSDNAGTQLDSLGHMTSGGDNHIYNGFTEDEAGGDFGLRKCGAETMPPIITRGVLLDIPGAKGLEVLPPGYSITVEDLKAALEKEQVVLKPGDTVLVRTGVLQFWGETGQANEQLSAHDSAGLSLEGAKWLVEENGAIMICGDTGGLEGPPAPDATSLMPVHEYLLVEQGVHIGEYHYLEELARDKVYEFCYFCVPNKIKGATAGFALRPVALR